MNSQGGSQYSSQGSTGGRQYSGTIQEPMSLWSLLILIILLFVIFGIFSLVYPK